MPEERPENQPDPDSSGSTPEGAESSEPVEASSPPDTEAADGSPAEPDASESDAPSEPEDDAAAEALRAAREALASIQAEADAAMSPEPTAPPPPPPAVSDPVGDLMGNDDIQAAFAAAEQEAAATPEPVAAPLNAKRLELPDFDLSSVQGVQHGLDLLADVQLDVRIELGRSRMLVEDVLRLNSGAVVELDRLAGDPLDVYVNDRLVARGEVLVLNDNFCIRINEIVDSIGEEATQASAN